MRPATTTGCDMPRGGESEREGGPQRMTDEKGVRPTTTTGRGGLPAGAGGAAGGVQDVHAGRTQGGPGGGWGGGPGGGPVGRACRGSGPGSGPVDAPGRAVQPARLRRRRGEGRGPGVRPPVGGGGGRGARRRDPQRDSRGTKPSIVMLLLRSLDIRSRIRPGPGLPRTGGGGAPPPPRVKAEGRGLHVCLHVSMSKGNRGEGAIRLRVGP